MILSEFFFKFVRQIEQFRADEYLDAAGKPTIGYGHLIKPGEVFDGPISPTKGEVLLREDAQLAADAVSRFARNEVGAALGESLKLTQYEFDALASFTFNVGERAFAESTLLRMLRSGERLDAAHEFRRWCHSGGRLLGSLRRRRIAEELWFLGGHPDSILSVLGGGPW